MLHILLFAAAGVTEDTSAVTLTKDQAGTDNSSRILILLILSAGINYIDRGALSVSAPLLAHDLALSPVRLGLLFSAFFWSYSIFQPLAGWLIDRYDTRRVLAGGYLLWSLATASVVWISRFDALFGARLALGVGESVAYPAYSKMVYQCFPENRRALANSFLEAAAKIGPAVGLLFGALLVAHFGWRALFGVLGVVSLLWLLPWMYWGPETRLGSARITDNRVSILQILRRREAWATALGMFGYGYVWAFLVTWLPTFMMNGRGFGMKSIATLGSLPFWCMACSSLLGGWLSDRWIAAGGSVTRVRKTFVCLGLFGGCIALQPVAWVHNSHFAMLLLCISCLALGFFASNVWAITQTLAGPHAGGSWTGIQNAIGNVGGAVSPYITGLIVGSTGLYWYAFTVCSAFLIVACLSYLFFLGEIRQVEWKT